MELNPPVRHLARRNTHRLIPSRYPSEGILDTVAAPEDLDAVFELEGWTNDRISNEVGIIHTIPKDEWAVGRAMSTIVMGAYCHPRPAGGRFNDATRGAWYAGFALKTAHAEAIHSRTRELEEIGGWFDTFVQMVDYLADFNTDMHDLRGPRQRFSQYLKPDSCEAPQKLGRTLLDRGSNGIVYPSVRDPDGTCLVCFRPRLVNNVRQSGFYEYRWSGSPAPAVRKL